MRDITVKRLTADLASDAVWLATCERYNVIIDADQLVPSALEVVSIGSEPFCQHGESPLMRCRSCLTGALTEATIQLLYRALTKNEMSDDEARQLVARFTRSDEAQS